MAKLVNRRLMKRFEFRVRQYPIAAGTHSWEANELESPCDPIPLAGGGKAATTGESLVGKYREIQDHLSRRHGVDIALIYVPSLDKFQELPDGSYEWTFYPFAGTPTG